MRGGGGTGLPLAADAEQAVFNGSRITGHDTQRVSRIAQVMPEGKMAAFASAAPEPTALPYESLPEDQTCA